MNYKDKINLIKQDWAYIFSVKSGKVVEKGNTCYQVPKLIAVFFEIYYGGALIAPIFLLWIIVDKYILNDFYISIGITILSYFILEFIVYMIIPIKKIQCWKTYSFGKSNTK